MEFKVKDILKPFVDDCKKFVENFGEDTSDENNFYIFIDDAYILVDPRDSYFYHEDDGTVVFRVNDY